MSLPWNCNRALRISDPGDLLTARRAATELGAEAGMSSAGQERVSLIATELGTNVLRNAPDGAMLLLRRLTGPNGVECICTDRGPGIEDIDAALRDGHATGPGPGVSLGLGLGAVRRLADTFQIHSQTEVGTAILARVIEGAFTEAPRFRFGAVMVPMAGMEACGDGWVARDDGLFALIDGLGHGPEASLAARRAEASLQDCPRDPREAVSAMHRALAGTRGAVAMVVQAEDQGLRYSGVGNIAATVIGVERVVQLHSNWGVIGANAAPQGPHETDWKQGDVLLLHSDGVKKANAVFRARHLRHVDPALAAAVLLRDATTALDDQTVLIVQR